MKVKSTLGKGSVFEFTLRLARATPQPESSALISSQDLLGLKLLIVTDNFINQQLLTDVIRKFGFQIGAVTRGKDCCGELNRSLQRGDPYQLVLMDYDSPLTEGFLMVKEVRNCGFGDLPIVMLSSDDRKDSTSEAHRLGVGYLVKPIKRELLLQVLDQLTSKTRAAKSEQKQGSGRLLRILLAEDSPDNVMLIRAFLKGTGHQLEVVENGAEALARYRKDTFDLVLMDMQMPVMDGYTATREIRQWEKQLGRSHTPVLALTAYALSDDIEKTRQAGCDGHISKPVRMATFRQTIDQFAADQFAAV